MLHGIHCMFTCPIDVYSVATVELSPGEGGVSGPKDSSKAREAVRATLDYLAGDAEEAVLRLDSPLPRGKGMASSTADVAAAIVATASALGRGLSPTQIAEIALTVEPSDGIMFPDIALFDHRAGRIARTLGPPPSMRIVILDFGGSVDTEDFNRVDREDTLRQLEPDITQAVRLIEEGIRRADPARIGRGATLSALVHQQVLFKPHLEAVLELSEQLGAVGINVAHSGTVIGLLLPDEPQLAKRAASLALRQLPDLESVLCSRIVGGGVSSTTGGPIHSAERRTSGLTAPIHGGLDAVELRSLGLRADEVLDFSANINPLGPSQSVRQAAAAKPTCHPTQTAIVRRSARASQSA